MHPNIRASTKSAPYPSNGGWGPPASGTQAQAPQVPAPAPYVAGPLPGVPNQGMPTNGVFQNVGGITAVNNTGDPRVLWEDGKFAIIHARDFPANTGMGRGPSRDDIQKAINTNVDPTRVTGVGPGSLNDFVKVVLSELLARPLTAATKKPSTLFRGRPEPKPMIASGYGSVPKGTVIPDAHYPHVCGMCGGWYYQGTGEHTTPDGKCPTGGKATKSSGRMR